MQENGPDQTQDERKKPQGERNPGASLQQRLRNHARAAGDDVALTLVRYVNERFLYRLSVSPYRDAFILRGATLFALWGGGPHRATRDVDLLAFGDSSPGAMRETLARICREPVAEDGVDFLTQTLDVEERAERRAYPGLHAEVDAAIGKARLRLHLDIAFGEAVTPPPVEAVLPVLLSQPPPRLRAYSRETAVAEKCEAMVSLGLPNTRLKDFYDLWHLSRTHAFEGTRLREALAATFLRRGTDFPADGLPAALSEQFALDPDKRRQWSAFLTKAAPQERPDGLPEVIERLRAFLGPPLRSLAQGGILPDRWSPDSGWSA